MSAVILTVSNVKGPGHRIVSNLASADGPHVASDVPVWQLVQRNGSTYVFHCTHQQYAIQLAQAINSKVPAAIATIGI